MALPSPHRIGAVVMRHIYYFKKSLDRLVDSIYWPIMDIIIWGLASAWLSEQAAKIPNITIVLLTAVVFWQIVWRASYEISVNLLEEFWNDNLVNFFSTPLNKWEWALGVMLVGLLKTILTVIVGVGAVWLLYSLNIFILGWYFIPFAVCLIASGWFLGFFASALIIYFGQRIQAVAWTMGFLLAPFSAVFYPLELLPGWARAISHCLPTTYVFEGMREIIFKGTFNAKYLQIAVLLNILYLSIALIFFGWMFEKRKIKGLARQG